MEDEQISPLQAGGIFANAFPSESITFPGQYHGNAILKGFKDQSWG